MDRYSILGDDPVLTSPTPPVKLAETVRVLESGEEDRAAEDLYFPGDDGGQSLANLAARDLDVTLQLLAERAKDITGATCAMISLLEKEQFVYRASAGQCAAKPGTSMDESSGIEREAIQTRKLLFCPDVANDPRVHTENCRIAGIASAMVLPLLHQQEVVGIFELLSTSSHGFAERDTAALQRMGEMVQTALDYAEAVKYVQDEVLKPSLVDAAGGTQCDEPLASESAEDQAVPQHSNLSSNVTLPAVQPEAPRAHARKCSNCGFPISESRNLCVDCEKTEPYNPAQLSFAAGDELTESQGWPLHYKYLLGIALATGAAAAIRWLR